jgi:hypothetical protein
VAVGEVAAVGQVQAHDGVAGREHGGVGGLVGLRAGVRLHVGVLGAEELLGAIPGQVLDDVGELAAAVVALAGIALGVLVGEDAGGGFEHRFGDEVLAGDQLELGVLALHLVLDGLIDLGIDFGQGPRHSFRCRHLNNSPLGGFHGDSLRPRRVIRPAPLPRSSRPGARAGRRQTVFRKT